MAEQNDIKYIVFDIESVPDAALIKSVKYHDIEIDEAGAVRRFQEEILANSGGSTYFIPVTFQYPVALCAAKVREDFTLAELVSLDEGEFRTLEITRQYWDMVEKQYRDAVLVTFNGRGFDIPLMELMAFRYAIPVSRHFRDKFSVRNRFSARHIDLHDWLSNYNAIRMVGGLNLLAKVIGKPGKMETTGDEVYDLYMAGRIGEINSYCFHDVLDTYFVFLRTRVMLGEISPNREKEIVEKARGMIESLKEKRPSLGEYLRNWA